MRDRREIRRIADHASDLLADVAAMRAIELGRVPYVGKTTYGDGWVEAICEKAGIGDGVEVPTDRQLRAYILETARKIVSELEATGFSTPSEGRPAGGPRGQASDSAPQTNAGVKTGERPVRA